jgi:hypothetical protein
MRYLFIPAPIGNCTGADGARFACEEIPESSKVAGPRPLIVADSIADACAQAGLTYHAPPVPPVPVPPPPRILASAAFIARIPGELWAKVKAAAAHNADLDKALFQLAASPQVHSDAPELLAMLASLVSAGVLTEAERTHILDFA